MRSKVLSVLAALALVLGAHAAILNVPATYSTIQSAITAATNGDTIVVAPGTYYENINFRGKNVLLTSLYYLAADTSFIVSTIINGSTPLHPDTASCVIFNSGEDSTAILQGFTITGGSGTKWQDIHGAGLYREGGGILIELSAPTVRHNVITHNAATDQTGVTSCGGGGLRIGDSNPLIYANVISFNQGRYGPGIVLNFTGCRIRNNLIYGNSGGQDYYGGSGLWILNNLGSTPKLIENNTIVGNSSTLAGGTGGISVQASTFVVIRNNIIRDNVPALQIKNTTSSIQVRYCDVQGGYSGTGNIDLDPLFTAQNNFLGTGSPCIDAGDTAVAYNDKQDPGNPGNALFPSLGLLRNDMGAYGGPGASLFPSYATITGMRELSLQSGISVFPDPMISETTVISPEKLRDGILRMYNSSGQMVLELGNLNGNQFKIRRNNLQGGMYFMVILQGSRIVAEKKMIVAG